MVVRIFSFVSGRSGVRGSIKGEGVETKLHYYTTNFIMPQGLDDLDLGRRVREGKREGEREGERADDYGLKDNIQHNPKDGKS